ncbi:Hypothetical Protein FCC1311_112962, partial [Hondaea fermentalgiana]
MAARDTDRGTCYCYGVLSPAQISGKQPSIMANILANITPQGVAKGFGLFVGVLFFL